MGVALQDRTVHKRAGVALVRVTANVLLSRRLRRRKAPFGPGGEAAAPASAQAGVLNGLDNLLRGHFGQGLAQRHIAVQADVFVDVLRVDYAAVFQCHTLLFRVKLGVVQGFYRILLHRLLIQKAGDDAPLEQMLGNDFRNILRFYHAVKSAFGINNHNGTQGAKAEASGFNDLDLFGQAVVLNLML